MTVYELRPPAPALRPYIENYWFVTHAQGEVVDIRVDVFVDARADLIFNFEAPYTREVIGGSTVRIAGSNLDAQRLVPIRIVQSGAVRIAGVRFRLGGVAPFVDRRLDEWTGLTPAPEAVFGASALEVEAALHDSADADAAARTLDSWFVSRLRADAALDTIAHALASLSSSAGRMTIGHLAAQVGTTTRNLQRLFARGIGLPPKMVGRVLRFQHALRALMADPGVPLGDVAADAGYFDQAHFVRDFRVFSGGVPRGYRGYYPPDGPADFAPNPPCWSARSAARD